MTSAALKRHENPLRGLKPFFAPFDVAEANQRWGANCGPAALAATMRRNVTGVKHLFPNFAARGYVNPTAMGEALRLARMEFTRTGRYTWPEYGLAFIQIDGPWCGEGVPAAAAYRHTHWVGVQIMGLTIEAEGKRIELDRGRRVYDVNADRWMHEKEWREKTMVEVCQNTPRATGGWWIRSGYTFRDPIEATHVLAGEGEELQFVFDAPPRATGRAR